MMEESAGDLAREDAPRGRAADGVAAPTVVFLIDSLGMGGAERLTVGLLRCLKSKHLNLRVCTFHDRDGNPVARDIEALGIPVDRVPVRRLREITALPRLISYLRKVEASLVHNQLEFAYILGGLASRYLGIPSVATMHYSYLPGSITGRARWRVNLMWWTLRRCTDLVISVSEETRESYLRLGRLRPEDIVTLHAGIDLSPFRPVTDAERGQQRRALGIPESVCVLMTVAVLRHDKGIQFMLTAMSRVLAQHPETLYVIVGDGEHLRELRALAGTLSLEKHVRFLGMREDIPEVMAAADAFVLPTLQEALPTVLSEAMARGLPIVASAVGGIPEMVECGVNGYLVEPGDVEGLADACHRLLADTRAAASMGMKGSQIVVERFDVEKQAERLLRLYLGLLEEDWAAAGE